MKEILVNESSEFAVPSGVNTLRITHEWGDVVINDTSVSGTYNFTPDSIGVHMLEWKNNTTVVSKEFVLVVQKYVNAVDFFGENPDLDTDSNNDAFSAIERRIRNLIDSYCGQRFGPYVNKTLVVDGDGGNSLQLPYKINKLISVTNFWGESIDNVYIDQWSPWFVVFRMPNSFLDTKKDITVSHRQVFSTDNTFNIVGNFGWDYVPVEVTESAKLLLIDHFTNSNMVLSGYVRSASMGDYSYTLRDVSVDTTGNLQVDLLLAPYVVMNIGMV
jgi:hypothetical protein